MKKNQKNDAIPSWREMFAIQWRTFQLLYRNYPNMMRSCLCCTIWQALTPYATIYLSAQVITEMTNRADPTRLQWLVLLTLGVTAGISLVSALLERWKNTFHSAKDFQQDRLYSQKAFEMDYVNLDKTETAELRSRLREYANGYGWGIIHFYDSLQTLCAAVAQSIGGIALTVSLFLSRVPDSAGVFTVLNHPLSCLLIIAVMMIVTYLSPLLHTRADSIWARHAGDHALANRLFSYFGFLGNETDLATDVRIYRQDILCDKFNMEDGKCGTFGSQGFFAQQARGSHGLLHAAGAAVSVLFTGLAYGFVCLKAWAGAFGLGAVTQYVAAITKLAGGVSDLIRECGKMRNNTPFLMQVFTYLDMPNTMYQGTLTTEKRSDRKYEVEFRNVSFRYPGSENDVLHNVNMKFEIGKRLAIVGMNGSGKTTFIKLLCRLYDPTEGEILLNGINIRKYNYRDYMDIFSVVFQDFQLFALPLAQNVASGKNYDTEKVIDCLTKAGFAEKLAKMPKGIETYLYKNIDKEGVDVSGGEAQKIAIARALYKDAPFIILDEPTAALDPIAEADIYNKFNDIAGDKTAIYISHRLSSCKFCDEILVFHAGTIVQQGTHEELLANDHGKYHELWHAQAQYYTEEEAAVLVS